MRLPNCNLHGWQILELLWLKVYIMLTLNTSTYPKINIYHLFTVCPILVSLLFFFDFVFLLVALQSLNHKNTWIMYALCIVTVIIIIVGDTTQSPMCSPHKEWEIKCTIMARPPMCTVVVPYSCYGLKVKAFVKAREVWMYTRSYSTMVVHAMIIFRWSCDCAAARHPPPPKLMLPWSFSFSPSLASSYDP